MKWLSPLKQWTDYNWPFALFLHFAAVMFSIPSERNEVPFFISLFTFTFFFNYAAFIRWRVKLVFDRHQIFWILAAWFPLFLFSCISASAFKVDPFMTILFLFGGISLQLFIQSYLMMSDSLQSGTHFTSLPCIIQLTCHSPSVHDLRRR